MNFSKNRMKEIQTVVAKFVAVSGIYDIPEIVAGRTLSAGAYGFYYKELKNRPSKIILHKNLSIKQTKLTIAHELGHHYESLMGRKPDERFADQF